MYLPDNIQSYLRSNNIIDINEAAKKEGDLFVAINVVNQQRRIISVDRHLIETMMIQKSTPSTTVESRRGLLKG